MIKTETENKLWLLGCALLITLSFLITVWALSTVTQPIGSDVYFHLHIAELFSKGKFLEGLNFSLVMNHFPYPPLFHLGETIIILTGDPYLIVRIFEAVLMPTTFTLMIILLVKKASVKAAFIAGLCLLGSLAFVDGAMQFRPESVDLLFYPLMLYAVLSIKKTSFIGMAIITIYSHGLAALSNIYGIAFKLLKEKQWRNTILIGLAAITPILAISIYYTQGAFKMWFTLAGANNSNPQQTLFWTQPQFFIPFYSGITLLGFVFLFKRNKSYFESILTWGVVGSMIMIPFWADRWLQYVSIPLSCLVGLGLKNTGWKKLAIIIPVLLLISLTYVYYWLWISISNQWWQPGA